MPLVHAGEYAVLTNGFRLHADRHEVQGDQVRLFDKGGVTAVSAATVSGFETEEYTPPASVALVEVPVGVVTDPGPTAFSPVKLSENAARKHGIPSELVQSVMATESAYNPRAVSPKGALGLMQLMPGTARVLGANPLVPSENVDAGAKYLSQLLVRYQDNDDQVLRALAAYNAGPGAVDRYHGVPPYRETRAYVKRVLKTYHKLKK